MSEKVVQVPTVSSSKGAIKQEGPIVKQIEKEDSYDDYDFEMDRGQLVSQSYLFGKDIIPPNRPEVSRWSVFSIGYTNDAVVIVWEAK